nr:hypothetical protein [Flagellimonas sp. 389]
MAPIVSLEDFSWSIAGNLEGTEPNILSELEWENLINAGAQLGFRYKVSNRFQIRVRQILAATISGSVMDTDYEENNRQSPVFNTKEDANRGFNIQSDLGITYDLRLGNKMYLTPYLGVMYSKQKLSIINTSNGLDSSYKPYTYGPAFGITLGKIITHHLEVAFESRASATKYRAEGDWNLIEELRHPVSFTHRANMYSVNAQLSLIKRLGKGNLALFLFYERADTDTGIDTVFFEDGTLAFTQFNGASRQTFRLGLSYNRWMW